MVTETWTPEETYALGRRLGEAARPSSVYCLNGDLGVGKTVFTQGFADGLGVEGPVDSPTFTIVKQYDDGRMPFYHFDVYRIGDISEMDEIGYEDCGGLIEEILPEDVITVKIEKDLEKGFDYRRITVEGLE